MKRVASDIEQPNFATQLFTDGVTTIPLFSAAELTDWRTRITLEVTNSVELVQGNNISLNQLVGGSFGAFGHPTSFHCRSVREFRTEAFRRLEDFISEFSNLVDRERVELLFDRLRFQPAGAKVGSEKKFHRDESTGATPGDVILGGWINLSNANILQSFSCLKGTQLAQNNGNGFVAAKPTAAQLRKKAVITVQPGSIILFYQNILHNVFGTTLKTDSFRLHYGLRFTNTTRSLFNLDQVFDNFEPARLPSGQPARMYPKLWWTNWRQKLVRFSANFSPQLLVQQSLKKDPTQVYTVVPTTLKLPQSILDQQPFPAYTDEEKLYYSPRLVQNIKKPKV